MDEHMLNSPMLKSSIASVCEGRHCHSWEVAGVYNYTRSYMGAIDKRANGEAIAIKLNRKRQVS